MNAELFFLCTFYILNKLFIVNEYKLILVDFSVWVYIYVNEYKVFGKQMKTLL